MYHHFDLDFNLLGYLCMQLSIAFLLALPIAINREMANNSAGLRTFPLVAIASCSFMLVGMGVYSGDAEARIMYAVITGMGFIGGGAIYKENNTPQGMATAASLWNTAAIGLSVAYGRYEIAIMLSVVGFIILHFATPVKKELKEKFELDYKPDRDADFQAEKKRLE